MVSYGFYVSTYLGSSITEDAFPALAARAQAKLNAYKRKYSGEIYAGNKEVLY